MPITKILGFSPIGALLGHPDPIGDITGTSAAAIKANKVNTLSPLNTTPTATQTVGDKANKTSAAGNLGRAALISTSPSGVLGSDPTGRRKLLGND